MVRIMHGRGSENHHVVADEMHACRETAILVLISRDRDRVNSRQGTKRLM